MDSNETSKRRRHIREPPSVPFLWESKPGIAKKNWMTVTKPAPSLSLSPAVKLIASVPFNWEEKPGTPLSRFAEEGSLKKPREKILPLPPAMMMCSEAGVSDWYKRSPPPSSLMANCLISSEAVSAAVPVVDSQWEEILPPSSPAYESDSSSTSSYETGRSSLVGSSFLECLFPLYRQASAGSLDGTSSSKPELNLPEESDNGGAAMIMGAPTLGDLIMMSRRRSIQRRAARMRLHNPSMELSVSRPFRCRIFPTGMKMVEGLQRKVHQTRLALL
ncbi:hypothetical protein LINGRAHAP2_LOCUS17090 [Linum grandiflorum]